MSEKVKNRLKNRPNGFTLTFRDQGVGIRTKDPPPQTPRNLCLGSGQHIPYDG